MVTGASEAKGCRNASASAENAERSIPSCNIDMRIASIRRENRRRRFRPGSMPAPSGECSASGLCFASAFTSVARSLPAAPPEKPPVSGYHQLGALPGAGGASFLTKPIL